MLFCLKTRVLSHPVTVATQKAFIFSKESRASNNFNLPLLLRGWASQSTNVFFKIPFFFVMCYFQEGWKARSLIISVVTIELFSSYSSSSCFFCICFFLAIFAVVVVFVVVILVHLNFHVPLPSMTAFPKTDQRRLTFALLVRDFFHFTACYLAWLAIYEDSWMSRWKFCW